MHVWNGVVHLPIREAQTFRMSLESLNEAVFFSLWIIQRLIWNTRKNLAIINHNLLCVPYVGERSSGPKFPSAIIRNTIAPKRFKTLILILSRTIQSSTKCILQLDVLIQQLVVKSLTLSITSAVSLQQLNWENYF